MKTVKISSFLKERKIKLKPEAANCSGLQRIEKIDFSGKIYLSPVQTNTDMILVKSGDLVISGINVEKGALAIYTDEEDVLASIHYSAYEFDAEKIDIDYLKWFLKSNIFRKLLLKQTGSGIKKEIKAKHLLPIEIQLPSLNRQHEIVRQIRGVADYIVEVNQQIQQQEKYAEMLRQSILQQAVEGKLCVQDPNDEPASVLLEKIKAEKERLISEKKIKKQKLLPPINDDEKPFDLPKGWEWCRLGTLLTDLKYGTSVPCSYKTSGVPVLRIPNIDTKNNCIDLNDLKFASLSPKEIAELSLKKNDILLIRSNGSASLVGRLALVDDEYEALCYAGYLIRIRTLHIDKKYLKIVSNASYFRHLIEMPIRTTTGVKNVNASEVSHLLIALPPFQEQKRIVAKFEILNTLCDELEEAVFKAKQYASQLMEAVLQEAFSVQELHKSARIIEFKPNQIAPKTELLAAARGKIREDTWEHLRKRALEIAGEES